MSFIIFPSVVIFLQPSHGYAFTDHPPHTSLVSIIDNLVSEEGIIQDTNERLAEDSSV
jgi:hypothetical protein